KAPTPWAHSGTVWLYISNPDAVAVFGIVRIDGHLIVVFRGSYTNRDWLLDVLVRSINPAGVPALKGVHSGFYSGTVEALDIIMMFYRAGDEVVIIGHSLGGARAEVVAEEMVDQKIMPVAVVTWGEPAPFQPGMPDPVYSFSRYRNTEGFEADAVTYST